MARKNAKARKRAQPMPIEELVAPPAAQLANGAFVREFVIDENTGQKALTYVNQGIEINGRQFKLSHLDRLYKAGNFTEDQFLAGKWYRDMHERGRYDKAATSNLFRVQGSVGSAEGVRDFAQAARDKWHSARLAWPADMLGFMDGLILRNRWPKMHHRERMRTLTRIREALDCMAAHLRHMGT